MKNIISAYKNYVRRHKRIIIPRNITMNCSRNLAWMVSIGSDFRTAINQSSKKLVASARSFYGLQDYRSE